MKRALVFSVLPSFRNGLLDHTLLTGFCFQIENTISVPFQTLAGH